MDLATGPNEIHAEAKDNLVYDWDMGDAEAAAATQAKAAQKVSIEIYDNRIICNSMEPRGTHSNVGGQLRGHFESRPLSNISLIWMLERLVRCGLQLPGDWRTRFPQDVNAPSLGVWHGWS